MARMRTLAQIRDTLESRGLAPKKSLGQNFLIDHNLIRKLIDSAGPADGAIAFEVGPGAGALTEPLLDAGWRVVACELDDGLCDWIAEEFAGQIDEGRLTLIRGDCLAGKRAVNADALRALGDGPFTHIANLPYGAATPLIMTLLVDHPRCVSLHVTIQREVAERLAAKPSTKAYGEIAVVAQALAEVRPVARVPPTCFWPQPSVESAMIAITRRDQPLTDDPRGLVGFTHRLFARRRKQLGSILKEEVKAGLQWPEGVRSEDRPEQLAPATIIDLQRAAEVITPRATT
ncbi:MAG: ribosomal RNA small subunit methyltransferase A [Phycisphaeraceae bacterium]|nr:ribosomal RNA small subunit methyltransferase A [Phycisphaeraceae bacterium]